MLLNVPSTSRYAVFYAISSMFLLTSAPAVVPPPTALLPTLTKSMTVMIPFWGSVLFSDEVEAEMWDK